MSPAFQGSRSYQLSAFPALRLSYGDRFFASVEEGVGYALLNTGGWSVGPLVKLAFGRDEDGGGPFRVAGKRDTSLLGLGDIDPTAEAGAFLRYRWNSWSAAAEVRHGIGGHDALVGNVSLSHVWTFDSPFTTGGAPGIFTLGPRINFAGTSYAQTYFGVTAAQSIRSGLRAYDADGGVMSYGVGGVMVAPVAPRTALSVVFGYERLGTPAGNSPLVRERGSRNQAVIGLFATYELGL